MKIIDKVLPHNQNTKEALEYYTHYYQKERCLFFDIETTGFIARNTTLYLIGVLWWDENNIYIRQWFNDTGYDEKELLLQFITFCTSYTTLIHFNGITFDLPYLKQKAIHYELEFNLDTNLYQIDILKEIRPYKKLLFLDNLKQKTIEHHLDIHREDQYSGGELINVYQRYVADHNAEKEQMLLLHNNDDLLGMISLSNTLYYKAFFTQIKPEDIIIDLIDKQNNLLEIKYSLPYYIKIPKRFIYTYNHIYINAYQNQSIIQIPIIDDELKHYFSDYKNYYYLPDEDTAIHKTLAVYVDSSRRQKATKANCYIKQSDKYVTTYYTENITEFQHDKDSKDIYIQLDSLIKDENLLINYLIAFHNQVQK